jgi:hypothetical protein
MDKSRTFQIKIINNSMTITGKKDNLLKLNWYSILLNSMDKCDDIFGVNPNERLTTDMVRDAIIKCIYEADKEVLDDLFPSSDFDSKDDEEQKKYRHVEIFIEKMFKDVKGDYHYPTKESLIKVIDRCAEYASSLRDKETIDKNYNQIMILINKLV